jgi:hypothetical protein
MHCRAHSFLIVSGSNMALQDTVPRTSDSRVISHKANEAPALGEKFKRIVQAQWLTLVILATQEAEIRRIKVQSQTEQEISEMPFQP